MQGIFSDKCISVVRDLSVDEQLYLYEKTRELKNKILNNENVDNFKINNENLTIYMMFFEDSTRTKESFRNAAKFHNCRVNEFNAATSSFNKYESIIDTVRMLYGYSQDSMFIVRSKHEGVCKALYTYFDKYISKNNKIRPAFINAGDGKHEHPTQEFLDEFSFLEQKNWETDSIHLALVGDLCHGRTVHSKADGLKIYKNVLVDLIAPKELEMPEYYIQKMKENGFKIRKFESIDEYIKEKKLAKIWYFTRLQLERMGEEILDKADKLRKAVSFRKDLLDKVPENSKFYHPLPRHREYPTTPVFLDKTSLNGWDEQSINGYYTRIIEIGLMGGLYSEDFKGEHNKINNYSDDFVEKIKKIKEKKVEYKVGIKPVDNGIVIDHIGRGEAVETIWNHIDKIRRIMNLNSVSSHGVYSSVNRKEYKGLISLPNILSFDERQIKMLGAIAPGCTLNIVENQKVIKKYRLHMPPKVYNFKEISCKNDNCISHPKYHELIKTEFYRSDNNNFLCRYCDKLHSFQEIWDV